MAGGEKEDERTASVQDQLGASFGVTPTRRTATVRAMLERGSEGAAGFWLQLVLAAGIAMLGLLLGSTVVILGGMLVSPLLRPLIELGTGLAIGSPLLVIRSCARVGTSVIVVVATAAALTLLVPIREVTSEIAARTSPTLLDLAAAALSAIAAVYATIREGSETTRTAAGTTLGTALVPPLCIVGFGLATSAPAIARGAALLFTANLSAIIVVSAGGFLALGYGRVDVAALEREEVPGRGMMAGAARRLSAFFASRLGPIVRIAMPLALLMAVYSPLRDALEEVTWEVRTRAVVRAAIAEVQGRSIESRVRVDHRRIYVRVVVIDDEAGAKKLSDRVRARVEASVGVEPEIEVVPVPDAAALTATETALHDRADPVVLPASVDLALARREVQRALGAWPSDAVGALLAWRVALSGGGPVHVAVLHIGARLGTPGTSILASALKSALHEPVVIDDVALEDVAVAADPDAGEAWLFRLSGSLDLLQLFPGAEGLSACVETPPDARREVSDLLRARAREDSRVSVRTGAFSRVRWSTAGCEELLDHGASAPDAGAPDAPDD